VKLKLAVVRRAAGRSLAVSARGFVCVLNA
jgi:hypothetical protein